MKLNYESIVLVNDNINDNNDILQVLQKCILVPYRKEHVLQYHEWMCQIELLNATASEPLSLQEEYIMQQTWYKDPKKCTFIILSKQRMYDMYMQQQQQQQLVKCRELHVDTDHSNDDNNSVTREVLGDTIDADTTTTTTPTYNTDNVWLEQWIYQSYNHQNETTSRRNHQQHNNGSFDDVTTKDNDHDDENNDTDNNNNDDFITQSLPAMIGDVNLFLSDYDDDINDTNNNNDDDDDNNNHNRQNHSPTRNTEKGQEVQYQQAEIDIMIAEKNIRNNGYGYEAVLLMMIYSSIHIRPSIQRYYCKVHETNIISQYLFTNKLHFIQCNYTECFHEYEYEFCCNINHNNNNNNENNSMIQTIIERILIKNHPSIYDQYKYTIPQNVIDASRNDHHVQEHEDEPCDNNDINTDDTNDDRNNSNQEQQQLIPLQQQLIRILPCPIQQKVK